MTSSSTLRDNGTKVSDSFGPVERAVLPESMLQVMGW
ncbi:hypothetical protein HNR61_004829 [Actinomadura namibiensis]|uniref:Uncharacterized protein n=1 Tax=Actinomadura namibiensis TaxID=182080 RepID=A0A7W3LRW5_ACTNM|nr:hypothetical protein [Actinomadura namibiensis]